MCVCSNRNMGKWFQGPQRGVGGHYWSKHLNNPLNRRNSGWNGPEHKGCFHWGIWAHLFIWTLPPRSNRNMKRYQENKSYSLWQNTGAGGTGWTGLGIGTELSPRPGTGLRPWVGRRWAAAAWSTHKKMSPVKIAMLPGKIKWNNQEDSCGGQVTPP